MLINNQKIHDQSKRDTYLIENKQPFSTSLIWQLQWDYFEDAGIEAWRGGEVPHYITSNPVVGKTYAEIVIAFLKDLALKGNTHDSVYLIELGAGHGKLCYHFMKHFTRLYGQSPQQLPPFCYVLSDFTEKNLAYPPGLVRHGSFSLSVNYHALKLYCENTNGFALFPNHAHFSLDFGCLLLLESPESYRETLLAYERFVDHFSPDDFYIIKKLFDQQVATLSFPEIISILRLSGYDARIFNCLSSRVIQLLPGLDASERLEFLQIVCRIWKMYYPLGEKTDLAYELGLILCMLGFFKEAVVYFRLSAHIYGITNDIINNLIMCYSQMQDYDSAIELLAALKNDPDALLGIPALFPAV